MIDPLTGSLAFATVVQLLAVFKSERKATREATIDEYLAWLRAHRFEQLADQIDGNGELLRSIETVLATNHDELMAAIGSVESMVAEVLQRVSLFHPVAEALNVRPRISDQAESILRQIHVANAKKLRQSSDRSQPGYTCAGDGVSSELQITDQRLIDADIRVLVERGLLYEETTPRGRRSYHVTRDGDDYGREMAARDHPRDSRI